jgi:hypothetical protein
MDDAENSNQATPDPNRNSPPSPPIVSPNNQSVLGNGERQKPNEEEEETKQLIQDTRTIEWLQFWVNAILALVGVVAIIVYLGQLSAMNKTLSEIQKQTPEIQKQAKAAQDQLAQARADSASSSAVTSQQISIMQQQVKANQDSVAAVQRQTAASEAAFQVDQRAWVGLSDMSTIGGIQTKDLFGEDFFGLQSLTISLRNSGKTPAIEVTVHCCLTQKHGLNDPIPDYDDEIKPTANAQYPVATQEAIQQINKINKGGIIAPGETATVALLPKFGFPGVRNRNLYILGRISYKDIFPGSPERNTKFCLMRVPSSTVFIQCPEKNWMN